MAGQFSTPVTDRYLGDYTPGAVHEFGPIIVTESEVIAFANQYDPQSIHTDPAAAKAGPFKGLIASGWHTIAMLMRLYMQNYLTANASLASPGLDELRWLKPVRPGDTLLLRVTVLETRPSRSKPDRGILFSRFEGLNQDGDVVVSFVAMNMIGIRPA